MTITYYSENYLPVLETGEIVDWVGVTEQPAEEYTTFNLTIGPNPAKNMLYLNFGAPVKNTVTVKLYDVQGRLAHSTTVEKGISTTVIPTSLLSNGIYFVKTTGDISHQEKIIIVK